MIIVGTFKALVVLSTFSWWPFYAALLGQPVVCLSVWMGALVTDAKVGEVRGNLVFFVASSFLNEWGSVYFFAFNRGIV